MKTAAPSFAYIAQSMGDGSNHFIGISHDGMVYTWGTSNAMGQLGRTTTTTKHRLVPTMITTCDDHIIVDPKAVYVGGSRESGHSVILTKQHDLYVTGCDRWQQLGLGSASGGTAGYTWEGGRIWRNQFVVNHFIANVMEKTSGNKHVRHVALGDDHTVILSENQRDVYTFGKGGEGQLGVSGKPFVSAPVRSTRLSSSANDIAAVCAIHHCSVTLDVNGEILSKAGKCRMVQEAMVNAYKACKDRATKDGLIGDASVHIGQAYTENDLIR